MQRERVVNRPRFVSKSQPEVAHSTQLRGPDNVADYVACRRGDLVALAYLLTGNPETAEDVVHDVVERLLTRDLGAVDDFHAYARRAVINQSATWGRRLKSRARRTQRLEAEWHRLHSIQPDPYGRIEVFRALNTLTTSQRSAIVGRYYLDLPDEEIAEALNCAPATVRSHLARGLKKMQHKLQEGDI